MTCREFTEFLDAYLDGELSDAERAEFERHLEVCESCVVYLETYEQTVRASKQAFADGDALPDDVPEELVRAIVAASRRRR